VGGLDCEPDISGIDFSPSGRRLYVGTEGSITGVCERCAIPHEYRTSIACVLHLYCTYTVQTTTPALHIFTCRPRSAASQDRLPRPCSALPPLTPANSAFALQPLTLTPWAAAASPPST
jgi:hypothetical protein